MSTKYPGGIISKTAPVPTGPYENGTASGIWTLEQQAEFVKQGIWPIAGNVQPDPFFENVTMLLHGDGTNGGQNNTFLDASTNNFTITRGGNATQGSFSPYGPSWSNYFDGASDYLNLGYQSALELTSQNFTIEFWLNQSVSAGGMICGTWRTNSSSYVWGVFSSGTALGFSYSTTGSYQSGNDGKVVASISIGVWTHIAVVRDGTTLTLYKDGTAVSTSTSMTNPVASGQQFWIGGNAGDSQWLGGYLSNLRITNTVVYSANFTPSITPLTAISGTQLLTCQNNRFVDNSTNNFGFTINGTPSVQRFGPFAPASPGYTTTTIGGSAYFDGSTGYVNTGIETALDLDGTDFTVEGWVYLDGSKTLCTLASFDAGLVLGISLNRTGLGDTYVYVGNGGGWLATPAINSNSSGNNLRFNQWNHVAFVKRSVGIELFHNGISAGATSNPLPSGFNGRVFIGAANDTSEKFKGYMADFRITRSALYTTAFTLPTAPFAQSGSLLLNFTNAAIFDNAMMNDLETVGNAQISTSVVKFGTGSISFDGSNSNLSTVDTPQSDLGSGDFTIEAWVYVNALNSSGAGWVVQWTSSLAWYFGTSLSPANSFIFGWTTDGSTIQSINSNTIVSTGSWAHYAVSRSGNTLRLFINGVLANSGTLSGTIFNSTDPVVIGNNPNAGGNWRLNGYIDDLRITKGVARYTANFTPPTAAFPNQ